MQLNVQLKEILGRVVANKSRTIWLRIEIKIRVEICYSSLSTCQDSRVLVGEENDCAIAMRDGFDSRFHSDPATLESPRGRSARSIAWESLGERISLSDVLVSFRLAADGTLFWPTVFQIGAPHSTLPAGSRTGSRLVSWLLSERDSLQFSHSSFPSRPSEILDTYDFYPERTLYRATWFLLMKEEKIETPGFRRLSVVSSVFHEENEREGIENDDSQ